MAPFLASIVAGGGSPVGENKEGAEGYLLVPRIGSVVAGCDLAAEEGGRRRWWTVAMAQ